MAKYTGIIFDFNGTLFWDTEKQEAAWRMFSEKLRGYPLSYEEMQKLMHGRTNKSLIEYLVGGPVDEKELGALIDEKELIYRTMCKGDPSCLELAPGAVELLDFLASRKIPRTIATASGKTNLDFFIDVFNLSKWFELDKIVYDDGLFPGKPDPCIYLMAADKIGLVPEKCIVVEDALSGIEAAHRANAGKIIAIGPKHKHSEFASLTGVASVIASFYDLDRDTFYHLV